MFTNLFSNALEQMELGGFSFQHLNNITRKQHKFSFKNQQEENTSDIHNVKKKLQFCNIGSDFELTFSD